MVKYKAIAPEETEIIGNWVYSDDKIEDDFNSKRIDYLTNNVLTDILVHDNGWNRLFVDERDNRYWELHFRNSELQGGGPKSLVVLDKAEVLRRYPDFREKIEY